MLHPWEVMLPQGREQKESQVKIVSPLFVQGEMLKRGGKTKQKGPTCAVKSKK